MEKNKRIKKEKIIRAETRRTIKKKVLKTKKDIIKFIKKISCIKMERIAIRNESQKNEVVSYNKSNSNR